MPADEQLAIEAARRVLRQLAQPRPNTAMYGGTPIGGYGEEGPATGEVDLWPPISHGWREEEDATFEVNLLLMMSCGLLG